MHLAADLVPQIPAEIADLGETYREEGRVHIRQQTGRRVLATVLGKRMYQVELELDRETLFGTCTCPRFVDRIDMCKHIWATVLEAGERGLGSRRPEGGFEFIADEPGRREGAFSPHPPSGGGDHGYGGSGGFSGSSWADHDAGHDGPGGAGPAGESSAWARRLADLRAAADRKQARAGGGRATPGAIAPGEPGKPADEVFYVLDLGTPAHEYITLRIFRRRRLKNGDWGAITPIGVDSANKRCTELGDAVTSAESQLTALLEMTQVAARRSDPYTFYYQRDSERRVRVPLELADTLLPLLVESGAFHVSTETDLIPDPESWYAIRDLDSRLWQARVEVTRGTDGDSWRAQVRLVADDERLGLDEILVILRGGLALTHARLLCVNLDPSFAYGWIEQERLHGPVEVEEDDVARFVDQMWALPGDLPVDWPPELQLRETEANPTPHLRVAPAQGDPRKRPKLRVETRFQYGEQSVASSDGRRHLVDMAERTRLARNWEAEGECLRELETVGATPPAEYLVVQEVFEATDLEIAPGALGALVQAALTRGWKIEADGKVFRSIGRMQMNIRSGIDWFDLHGGADFGGEVVPLPQILAARKRGDRWVKLGDGSFGMLPEAWLEQHGMLLEVAETDPETDTLRFARSQALVLDAMLAARESAGIEVDEGFAAARARLQRITELEPKDPPAAFVGELRPYQKEGLAWIGFLGEIGMGGCLADDMGLGKTVQVLAHLATHYLTKRKKADRPAPSLIVVPKSLVFNWMAEAKRFTPKLRVLDHTGSDRARTIEDLPDCDVILTTYGVLRRDIEMLEPRRFSYVILDEAQAIKNAASISAKAARLVQADHRLALTGTPVENHIGELWSLMEFLNPGMLGSSSLAKRFTSTAGKPAQADIESIGRAIGPLVLRRTKDKVASDLPAKNEQTLYCDLEPQHRKIYDEIRDHYRSSVLSRVEESGLNKSKMHVLEALLRLRQAACHPALIDDAHKSTQSSKLKVLLEYLEEARAEGHKALVFSQFTSLLALVRKELDKERLTYEYLDGRTRNRQKHVERFQEDPDCPLFLISLKAGGHGLNLTAAEYVFLLDPWWNPAVEAQAIDRTHRIGQTRKVFAYRIIARDTVEEKVLALQEDKRKLADAILSGSKESVLRDLDVADLEMLLS